MGGLGSGLGKLASGLWILGILSACAAVDTPPLTPDRLASIQSAGAYTNVEGEVLVDNDEAFEAKLRIIRQAETSLDAMYFIYADDYSSSVFSKALIDAAARGVHVRLLVDYFTNYSRLDHFSMMERKAREAGGKLEVRFFNRPTGHIIRNAAYLTSGCGGLGADAPDQACAQAKTAAINDFFAGETIDGKPAATLNISNRNTGFSGIFLSGLYAKEPDLMAYAVTSGQGIDPQAVTGQGPDLSEEDKRKLADLGKLYWHARTGSGFAALSSRIKLALAFALYGDTIDPVFNQFTAVIPAETANSDLAARDWEYFTQFLHHKLLLADDRLVQLGGRNIEDSYHMEPNELIDKYVFMDTDLWADLGPNAGLGKTFDDIWNFRVMVATLAEVRMHAPNDMAANMDAWRAAQETCEGQGDHEMVATCTGVVFSEQAVGRGAREDAAYARMMDNAATFERRYDTALADQGGGLGLDQGANVTYLENLVFRDDRRTGNLLRQFETTNGREALEEKNIHALWLSAMRSVCQQSAIDGQSRRMVFHNAYFFPSSNLIAALAKMIDGTWNCANVDVVVLTNSLETTDLAMVNLFARHGTKAFSEYVRDNRSQTRGATVRYLEYVRDPDGAWLSLHSKVAVIGDMIFVGSANMDVRSYVLDTNNGFLVRNAPQLVQGYLDHIDRLTADPDRIRYRTGYFAATPRETILAEDMESLRQMLARYRAERWIDAEQVAELERRAVDALNETYSLTRSLLQRGPGAKEAAETYNRKFKPI